jgi:integrase
MKNNKINFTKAAILNLPLPLKKGQISYFYDQQVNGLGIMLFNSGTRTFFLYKRINGKPDKIKLGRFPEITIEQARRSAYSLINDISHGVNPKDDKKILNQTITFQNIFDAYIERHGKLHKKTWQYDIYQCKTYLSSLLDKKIRDINKAIIMDLHSSISRNNGIYTANRALSLLHTIFNKAIEWGWEGVNPCNGIKKFKEKSRERFIHGDELPRFFEALNNEPNEIFRDFFYICLLTGARRGNVLSMNWKDINLVRGTWNIKETKNGEEQIVPLSGEVIAILKCRLVNKTSDWVFPSSNSASGHIEEPKKAWKRVIQNAGIEDLRIHDLRRTLGSWQAATGANSFIIGKSLGHKTQSATAIYARLNLDPVRESVSKATSAMLATIKHK